MKTIKTCECYLVAFLGWGIFIYVTFVISGFVNKCVPHKWIAQMCTGMENPEDATIGVGIVCLLVIWQVIIAVLFKTWKYVELKYTALVDELSKCDTPPNDASSDSLSET